MLLVFILFKNYQWYMYNDILVLQNIEDIQKYIGVKWNEYIYWYQFRNIWGLIYLDNIEDFLGGKDLN